MRVPFNFGWVVEGRLAASGLPGGGPYPGGSLEADLQYFRSVGIGLIISLTEWGIDKLMVEAADMTLLHLPVADMMTPGVEEIDAFLQAATEVEDQGQATLVHCHAGLGRTGTLAACYLVRDGLTDEAAVERIRQLRPGSIETADQETAVRNFAARCAGRKQQA